MANRSAQRTKPRPKGSITLRQNPFPADNSIVQSPLIGKWIVFPETFVEDVIKPPKSHLVPTGITWQQRQGLREYGKLIYAREKRYLSQQPGSRVVLSEEEMEYAAKYGLSIQSGQGTGKDAFLAWVILHFLCCFKMPLVCATAPTADQLERILWSETFKWYHNTPLVEDFTHQHDKIFLKQYLGKKWVAFWKTINTKATEEEQAVTLAGLHEDNMLWAVDEATGVPDPVYKPIEGSMTQRNNLAIVIFNPTQNHGYAIRTQTRDRHNWACLRWNSEDSELVSKDHIFRMREKYGRQSNMYRIRILGLSPRKESDSLIDFEWVMTASERKMDIDTELYKRVAGLDVAGGGSAKTVLAWGTGPQQEGMDECHETRSKEIAYWVYDKLLMEGIDHVCIDTNGIGVHVAHILEDLGIIAIFCDVNTSADDPDRFQRLRDEIWWDVRTEFEENRINILPHDEAIGQLTVVKYKPATGPGTKIKVQGKDEIRKHSTMTLDEADAIVLWRYCNKRVGKRGPSHDDFHRRQPEDWRTV